MVAAACRRVRRQMAGREEDEQRIPLYCLPVKVLLSSCAGFNHFFEAVLAEANVCLFTHHNGLMKIEIA